MANLVQTIGYYRWKLADHLHHCTECAAHAGQVKSKAQWDLAGSPPLHPGCGCSLIFDHAKTEAAPDGPPDPLTSPATPDGVNHETPPGSPIPDPDDYQPENPPQTPTSTQPKRWR